MQSTLDKILSAWNYKQNQGNIYRGSCPFNPKSDGNSFVLTAEDGEHGAWIYHAADANHMQKSGSLYELAGLMGIEITERPKVPDSKGEYANLKAYAEAHYVPESVFLNARWQNNTYSNTPAISWDTTNGTRFRLLDGSKNPYRNHAGYKNCWYGLDRAIRIALQEAKPIVLCNGEASVVVAQHFGIPAFSGTGGEGAMSETMLSELTEKWSGDVWIALDCDDTGRGASKSLSEKIENAAIVDLGLSDKGDLADFCGLHRDFSFNALKRLISRNQDSKKPKQASNQVNAGAMRFISSRALLPQFSKFVEEDRTLLGRVIEMPFEKLREMGGFAERMTTKKVWLIGNVSGGGKTIWSEALCNGFSEMGINNMYIGDEWTPMEMITRQIQRFDPSDNPVTYMDFLRYANGDFNFDDATLSRLARVMRHMRSWHGETFYAEPNPDSAEPAFLEDIMLSAANTIRQLRANGTDIQVIILDYLSLYDTRNSVGNNMEEYKLGVFKSWCKQLDVLGISTVQVKKAAEERVKTQGGYLRAQDLLSVRPDKGQLISTMNRVYQLNGDVTGDWTSSDAFDPYLEEGEPLATPNFVIVTAKNSVASPNTGAFFHFNWSHMRVMPGLHPDYEYDKHNAVVRLKPQYASLGDI